MLGHADESSEFHVSVLGGRRANRERADALLNSSSLSDENQKLNHKKFLALTKLLKTPPPGIMPPKLPETSTDGSISGWLMHQGRLRGYWKRAWFVLKPPYLFQYESDASTRPKSTFVVSYALPDRVTAEDIEAEVADINHITKLTKLEERAGSLRINVYTSSKLKVLTASTEDTMERWLAAFEASVRESTTEELLAQKVDAAQALKPILTAQMFSEVDVYVATTIDWTTRLCPSCPHPRIPSSLQKPG